MITAVFVIGPSRSGTSVLAQALGRGPEILATEELHYYNLLRPAAEAAEAGPGWLWARLEAIQREGRFFEIKNGTLTDLPEPDMGDLPGPDTPILRAFFERLAQEVGAQAVVEQTPINLYYREEVRRDFPEAIFVLMRRDPRAIIASQKMRWKVGCHGGRAIPARDITRVRYAGHPILQLWLLQRTLRAMAAAQAESDVVPVAYEELVTEPARVLSKLAARLGLPYGPAMTQVSDAGSSHAAEGGRTGFDPSRLESWRSSLNQTEIWLTERLCADALSTPATGVRPRAGELARLVLGLPWAVMMALYYSTAGYGNLFDAVRRRFLR